MSIIQGLKNIKHKLTDNFNNDLPQNAIYYYADKFLAHAFSDGNCITKEQYEASITRLYHTIEKGMAYEEYRSGFGRANVELIIDSLTKYAEQYDIEVFFYKTALSCLNSYVEKNKECGLEDAELEAKIKALPGTTNHCGGTITVKKPETDVLRKMNYEQLVTSRHSIRHFSGEPVDIELLKKAISLAQYTPSACNRQGWKTRIIADGEKINIILGNQNGNRGFGQEIDKLLIVTGDLRYFQKNREAFQVFIDGGMYAESVINSLYYYGIGSIPLSASLVKSQEDVVRKTAKIDDAEELILFIGVGNYPEKCLTAQSERKTVEISVI